MTTTTTRIRRSEANMGSAWLPYNRPPLKSLPAPLAKLLTEHDEITARLEAAEETLADYRDNYPAKLKEAQDADAQANADAARHGKPINATAHVDALRIAKENAEATQAAMTQAKSNVFNEAWDAKDTAREDPKYATATDKARAEIAEAAAPLLVAITAATEAAALEEWVTEGLPYDTTAALSVNDLMSSDGGRTVTAAQIIAALTRIAG